MKPIVILRTTDTAKKPPGKRSPGFGATVRNCLNGEFNRDIVRRIAAKIGRFGDWVRDIDPETNDVSLAERCRRANEIYRNYNEKAFLVSVHANAGGGTGWEALHVARRNESGCNRHGICRGSATGIRPGRLAYAFRLCRRRPG